MFITHGVFCSLKVYLIKSLKILIYKVRTLRFLAAKKKQLKSFQISVVHVFRFRSFAIFCVNFFSFSFSTAYVVTYAFIFDFPVCFELTCLGVLVVKVLAKNPLFSSFSDLAKLLDDSENGE